MPLVLDYEKLIKITAVSSSKYYTFAAFNLKLS